MQGSRLCLYYLQQAWRGNNPPLPQMLEKWHASEKFLETLSRKQGQSPAQPYCLPGDAASSEEWCWPRVLFIKDQHLLATLVHPAEGWELFEVHVLASHVEGFTLHCSQLPSWALAILPWTRRQFSSHPHCHLSLPWVPTLLSAGITSCTLSLAMGDPPWINPDRAGA